MFIFVCTALGVALFSWRWCRKENEALAATLKDCDAGDRLMDWFEANPGFHPSYSAHARALIEERILTYREFLRTHPYVKDSTRHEEWLRSLLVPPPDPKTPKSRPTPKRPQNIEAVFYLPSSLTAGIIGFGFLKTRVAA